MFLMVAISQQGSCTIEMCLHHSYQKLNGWDEESTVPVILAAASAEWRIQILNPKKEKRSGQTGAICLWIHFTANQSWV